MHSDEEQMHELVGPTALNGGEFACGGSLKSGAKWGCGRQFDRAIDVGLHFQSKEGRICIQPLLDEQRVERRRLWEEEPEFVRPKHQPQTLHTDDTGNDGRYEDAEHTAQEGNLSPERPAPVAKSSPIHDPRLPGIMSYFGDDMSHEGGGADTPKIGPPVEDIRIRDGYLSYDISHANHYGYNQGFKSHESTREETTSDPATYRPLTIRPNPVAQTILPDALSSPDISHTSRTCLGWGSESHQYSRNQHDLDDDSTITSARALPEPSYASSYIYNGFNTIVASDHNLSISYRLEYGSTSDAETPTAYPIDGVSYQGTSIRGFRRQEDSVDGHDGHHAQQKSSLSAIGKDILRPATAMTTSTKISMSNSVGGKLATASQDQVKSIFRLVKQSTTPNASPPELEFHSPQGESEGEGHGRNAPTHVNSEFGASRLSHQQSFKSDVPFTDSGYASAANHNYPPTNEFIGRPTATDTEYPTDPNSRDQDDSRTRYSEATTTRPEIVQKSVYDVCSNIYNRLGRNINGKNWELIYKSLPYLIKAFAVKLGSDSSNELELGAMYFIHKHHQEIATQLKRLFHPDEEDEPETHKDNSGAMSLFDKMNMWGRQSNEEDTEINPDDLFEGIEDDNEDADLSAYGRMVVNSAAYEWLISSLIKESSFHWDDSLPNVMVDQIRQKVLERLPTGTISKTKAPHHYEVSFGLPWLPLQRRLEKGTQHELITPKQSVIGSFAVAICSSTDQLQLATVKEYMDQTWPSSGRGLLGVIEKAIHGAQGASFSRTLADKTRVEAVIRDSYLDVSVTGPTYSIAECGEQLAWLAAALLPTDSQAPVYATPSLKYVTNHDLNKPFGHYWIIETSEVSMDEMPDLATQSKLHWLRRLGSPAIVRGFPITLRPENHPGIEISPRAFGMMGTLRLRIDDERTLLRLAKRTLELCHQTKGWAVWHILESSHEACSCRHILSWEEEDDSSHTPIDRHKFWKNRHILGDCASALLSLSSPEPQDKPCYDEEASEIPLDSEEHSSSKDSLPGDASPEISADSLDSDMLSMSNSSEGLFPGFLDSENPIFPIVDTVSNRLVSGYRNSFHGAHSLEVATRHLSLEERSLRGNNSATSSVGMQQAASSPGPTSHQLQYGTPENGTQYSLPQDSPSTAPSASPVRPSKKRSGGDEPEDDSEGENSIRKPKSKRPKQNNSKEQKLFACPFWKQDPSKHRDCFPKKLDMISRVKQHLARKHTPTFYCERCFTQFTEERSHQAHMREETERCRWDASARLDGISHQQHRELSRKSKTDLTESEKWFAIWDIVFPGHPKPSSPYMDPGLSEDFCSFREFSQSRGPAILAEELQTRGLFMSHDGMDSSLQIAIARGFNTLFEEWLSSQDLSLQPSAPSGSSPLASARQRPPRQTKTQAGAGSSADSGVELGSQVLSNDSHGETSFSSYIQARPMSRPEEDPNARQYELGYLDLTAADGQFQHINDDIPQPLDASNLRHISQDEGLPFDIGLFDHSFNQIYNNDGLMAEFPEDGR